MAGKKSPSPIKKSVKDLQNEVKEFQNELRAKEAEMQEYAKKFRVTVKHLRNSWNGYNKDLKKAANQMREGGIVSMKKKVEGFKNEILKQKKENQSAIARMKGDVQLFLLDVKGKKKDFASYTKAFWG